MNDPSFLDDYHVTLPEYARAIKEAYPGATIAATLICFENGVIWSLYHLEPFEILGVIAISNQDWQQILNMPVGSVISRPALSMAEFVTANQKASGITKQ